MQKCLAELKLGARLLRQRSDMVWYLLLDSITTQGNVRGWENLKGNSTRLNSVSYTELAKLTRSSRLARLSYALRKAGVRMPNRKSKWLAANFEEVQQLGGARRATRNALALRGRRAKLEFVKRFKGFGPKYLNNFWMVIYDRDFRDCVAFDARLKKIAHELDIDGSTDCQEYFRVLAQDAGRTPWEVDRLLFWFTDYFRAAMRW
jgi:hypothetical protein